MRGSQLSLVWATKPKIDALQTVDGGRTWVGVSGQKFVLRKQGDGDPPAWLAAEYDATDELSPGQVVHILDEAAVKRCVALSHNGGEMPWNPARVACCGLLARVAEVDPGDATARIAPILIENDEDDR